MKQTLCHRKDYADMVAIVDLGSQVAVNLMDKHFDNLKAHATVNRDFTRLVFHLHANAIVDDAQLNLRIKSR